MLPRRINLVVPTPLPGGPDGLSVELVDTRGFDGNLGSRSDLIAVLRDPRTVIVLCTPFKEAPGAVIRDFLKEVIEDAILRPAAERITLLLLDHGDGEGVNGAGDDRLVGQEIRMKECERNLSAYGLGAFAVRSRLIAFDALQDDPQRFVDFLSRRLADLRDAAQKRLDQQVADALLFLKNLPDDRTAMREVDRRLSEMIIANAPDGAPPADQVGGLLLAFRECKAAARINASVKREGRYPPLDAYSAVRTGASRSATEWFGTLDRIMEGTFRALERDSTLTLAAEHIRLRHGQYDEGRNAWIDEYADNVKESVENSLGVDLDVWQACADQWGAGPGYTERVLGLLGQWGRRQAPYAYGGRDVVEILPVALPIAAPMTRQALRGGD